YLHLISETYFLQAEDDIRIRNVTGVQTCALPIFTDGDTSRKSEAPMIRYSLVESTRNKCGRGREFSHDVRRFIGATEKCFTYGDGWGCALDAADQSLEKLASG